MKKLLIALSTLFIVACSDGDIGGYTESIIKGASAPEANASEQQPSLLKKSSSPLDEDLSGLDEEELREKLMNSYPWPKPEGVAAPSSSSGSGGSSGSRLEGSLNLPHNPSDGEILPFSWKNVNPSFAERENGHEYGFDRDPSDRDPVVYISTKNGVGIAFDFLFDKSAFSDYYLLNDKESVADIENKKTIPSGYNTLSSDAAVYTLYGCLDRQLKRRSPTCYNTQKKIQVIPYELVEKNIIYVEFDDQTISSCEDDQNRINNDNKDGCVGYDYETLCKDGFTKCCAEKYINDVFKQAVMKVNVYQLSKCLFGKQEKLEVQMSNPKQTHIDQYTKMKFYADRRHDAKIGSSDNYSSPFWHIVYAINKERKIWHLKECNTKDFDLSSCQGFRPEREPKDVQYFLTGCDDGEHPVTIKAKQTINNGSEEMHYYINENDGKFKECHILFTDNGYPVVPSKDGIEGFMRAMNAEFMNDSKFYKYLRHGGIIFVPRRAGESGLYTLAHELGHSFGLVDVSLSEAFRIKQDDDSDKRQSGFKNLDNGNVGYRQYKNLYASSETNVMAWESPVGRRLRYRPTPIACTDGTSYYKELNNDGSVNKEGGRWGTIERRIPDGTDTTADGTIIKDWDEFQWECVRGKCYDENSVEVFASKKRQQAFKLSGWCDKQKNDKKDPINRYAENQRIFNMLRDSSLDERVMDLLAKPTN